MPECFNNLKIFFMNRLENDVEYVAFITRITRISIRVHNSTVTKNFSRNNYNLKHFLFFPIQ
jgi:hypothetical protein